MLAIKLAVFTEINTATPTNARLFGVNSLRIDGAGHDDRLVGLS